MSFAWYGELYRLIEGSERLSENLVRYLCAQLLNGLEHLHTQGVVHRDIKPENLLIDRRCRLVIADFNFSRMLEPYDTSQSTLLPQKCQYHISAAAGHGTSLGFSRS